MRRVVLALALISAVTPVLAATKDTTSPPESHCPIKFNADGTGHAVTGIAFNRIGMFEVKFSNTGDQSIIGAQFGLDMMNPVGDFNPYIQPIDIPNKVNPGKSAHFLGQLEPAFQYRRIQGFRLYLRKLAFSDGQTWEDDGTMRCRIEKDYRNH